MSVNICSNHICSKQLTKGRKVFMATTKRWKFPCGHCSNPVKSNQQGVFCECCQLWYHCKCLDISGREYSYLQASNSGWCCPYCFHSALPFADCSRLSSASAPVSTLSVSDTSLSSAATLAPPPSTGISLYLANSRSLIPKMDDLRLLVCCPELRESVV